MWSEDPKLIQSLRNEPSVANAIGKYDSLGRGGGLSVWDVLDKARSLRTAHLPAQTASR